MASKKNKAPKGGAVSEKVVNVKSSGSRAKLTTLPGSKRGSTGFIGFGAFSNDSPQSYHSTASSGSSSRASNVQPIYMGANSDLAVASKRLTKRDPITKLKALAELQTTELSQGDMRKWVPHWLHLFKKLSLDEDRRVREAASATLEAFIRQAKREFAPHLGELMGPWWCLMGDSASEVAASGQRAFEASFPPRRRPDLLAMCADSMVEYLSSCAQLTLEGFSAKVGCSTEEVEERSEKAVVAAMNGLSRLLSALREEDNKALAVPGGRYSRAMDSSMWRHLQASQPALRRAAYNLLSACCQAVPSFLEEGPQKQVQELAEVVFGALGEPEPANHAAMWSAVTVFVQAYPAAWEHMDVSRSVLPKLFKQLRQGQYLQSASASYPSLLPLLAHIPEGSIRGFSGKLGKGKVGFCKQLLGAVWQGLRAEVEKQGRGISACEATLLVTAQLECAVYLLLSLREEEEQSSAVAEALAGHILLVYEAVLEVPGYSGVEVADKFVTSADREGLARCLGAALVQLDKDRPMVVGSNVWGGLNGVIEAVVEGRMAGSVQLLGAVLESAARSTS